MTEKLPEVLAEIASVVGEIAALKIAARKGGTRVYMPAVVTKAHWLTAEVGFDAARKLCDHFAVAGGKRGVHIEIPMHVGGTYKQFMRAISERIHKLDTDEHASSAQIARTLGVTQRTVHRHRGRHRGKRNKKQLNLL